MKDKRKSTMDLQSIIGGGMKNLINSVDANIEEVQEPENVVDENSMLKTDSFVIERGSLDDNINYYLRVKKDRKQVYIDVDTLRKLEQILLNYKYNNNNVKHIPVGTFVSAILKTFFDANGIK